MTVHLDIRKLILKMRREDKKGKEKMGKLQITGKKQAKKIVNCLIRQRKKEFPLELIPIETFISTGEALKLIKDIAQTTITLKTLLVWVVKHKLGRKIGGRWVIYRSALLKFINE